MKRILFILYSLFLFSCSNKDNDSLLGGWQGYVQDELAGEYYEIYFDTAQYWPFKNTPTILILFLTIELIMTLC